MECLNIKRIGDVAISEPSNWCSIADLSMAWMKSSGDNEDIRRVRLCSAAIGIVWNKSNTVKIPEYDWKRGNIWLYGATVQDLLMRHGVQISDIMMSGISAFKWIQELMPSVEEVEETTDFSEAQEGERISSP